MIVAAALCPAPPLLISPLNGGEPAVTDLRQACLDAVGELVARDVEVMAVVGAGEETRTWGDGARLNLLEFAPGLRKVQARGPGEAEGARGVDGARGAAGAESPPGAPGLPASLGVAGWLLDQAGYRGPRLLLSLADEEPAPRCALFGAELAGAGLAGEGRRAGLLVMADGSARRTLKAPGYLDERAAGFDAEIERAVREADLDALLRVDPALAADLMAAGRPAWQALAGALAGREVAAEIRYSGDPFGVAYLVASLMVAQ